MTRNTTQAPENRLNERVFSSPIALAYVRTVMARNGLTETEARQRYLNYLTRIDPSVSSRRTRALVLA